MRTCWGHSPKLERIIPLDDLAIDRYLIIAKQVFANLGWSLSHISSRGIVAYTPISLQSYSEEISIRIEGNTAIFKSECVGIQLLFNDYGKNALNLDLFVLEFSYAAVQVEECWTEGQGILVTPDSDFDQTPLSAKRKIKNVFYLLIPQENYVATPIIIFLNVAYFGLYTLFIALFYRYLVALKFIHPDQIGYYFGANNRELVQNGHYWRLITHQFSHWSFFHLFFNMYALAYIGLLVEHNLGFKKYICAYLISGVCGGLVSLLYHESGYMTGASGAIMGLFGAFLALLTSKVFERNATKALLISTGIVVLLMLINGAFKKNVDNAAHIGGLVAGFISAYLLYNRRWWKWEVTSTYRYVWVGCLTLIFSFAVLHGTHKIQTKEFLALEKKYMQNWNEYAKLYTASRPLSKAEQLHLIQTKGIGSWKRNDLLVKEMLQLNLTKKQRAKAEFHAKVVPIKSRIVELLYKERLDSTKYYRREIRELTRKLNALRMEDR